MSLDGTLPYVYNSFKLIIWIICFSPRPLKLMILIICGAFWVYRALWDMLNIIVSNSHFGKRPAAREMTTLGSHVGSQSANYHWWNFAISAVRPFPGWIFGFLLLPCAWELELWVYQLWRMDFLWICWFSTIYILRLGMRGIVPSIVKAEVKNLPWL